jgi:NADPH2:quinone reductase
MHNQAWVSHAPGGPETLVLEERPVPTAGDQELLVRVQAVGINYPDGLLIRDLYQLKPPRPLVPGSEFCGVVERVGSGCQGFQEGDTVIGRCGWGAMAQRIALSAERCVKLPAALPPTQAAAFLFAYATAYHALVDAARLRPGETVLVLGAAGGVGSATIDLSRALGARPLAAASSEHKLRFARSCGALDGLVYDPALAEGAAQRSLAQDFKRLAPDGVNVVVDPVGGAYAEPALRSLAPGGRHLVLGFTAGIPRMPLNLALLKRCHILGVDWRAFVQDAPEANARNVQALVSLWTAGRLRPRVTEVLPWRQAPEAIARLERRDALGKLVVDLQA